MKQKEILWNEQYRYLIQFFNEQIQTTNESLNLKLLFEHDSYQIIANQKINKQYLSPLYQYENTMNCFLDFLKTETDIQKIEYIIKDQQKQGTIMIKGMVKQNHYQVSLISNPKMLKKIWELYQLLQLQEIPKVKYKKHVCDTTFIMK